MERGDRTRPSFSLCTWSTRLVGSERRHPVYVLEQSNEAYYFRLDETLVRTWLMQADLGCADAALLAQYPGNFAACVLGRLFPPGIDI
jgi:hypothetical protein